MADAPEARVAIVGAGIGGLTLALACTASASPAGSTSSRRKSGRSASASTSCRTRPPSCASSACSKRGAVAVTTREAAFFNRFGQLVYASPRDASPATRRRSSRSIAATCRACCSTRCGARSAPSGRHRPRLRRRRRRDADAVRAALSRPCAARRCPTSRRPLAIGCDGIHSAIRRQLYPARRAAALVGRQHVARRHAARAVPERRHDGPRRLALGRQDGDLPDQERHRRPRAASSSTGSPSSRRTSRCERDWNARGKLGDFFAAFAGWHFDWLDVAALIAGTETVLAYPMVDQDPLPRWSFGRVTLLGDAAHPMLPRGSNGAGQAILDALCLADALAALGRRPRR